MAGTVTETRTVQKCLSGGKKILKVRLDWVADASAATVPTSVIKSLNGFLVKAVTNPGTPTPTNNLVIKLLDPDFATLDSAEAKFATVVNTGPISYYPAVGSQIPVLLAGDYTFSLTGNAVNSAQGSLVLYIVEDL